MAITLITIPQDVTAAYNPIILTASSDNTAQPNFKFVIDIVFSYPTGITTKRIKMSPRPDGFLLIDSHRIIENYCTFDFSVGDATDALDCPNSYIEYELRIGEEYGTPPLVYPNLDTATGYAINSALKHSVASFGGEPDLINVDLRGSYMMSKLVTLANKPFLTSSPRTLTICNDKNYYLYALVNVSNEPAKLRLRTYDANGTIITSHDKVLSATTNAILRYGVGTKNINDWDATYLAGASSYDVRLFTNPGIGIPAAISELFTFNIDCDCSKYNEHFRLHWLNPLGGFDAYSFNMRFDRTMNLKKSSFKKILGAVDGSGNFSFSPSQAGKVQFDTLTTEQVKINSNWITEAESEWLFTLAKSTQVFWEIDSETYAPVIITNTSYKQKTYAGDHLFNIDFTLEVGNDIISQRQ